MTDERKIPLLYTNTRNGNTQTVPLSQGEVAQVDCARQRQAVVSRQALAVFITADADLQNVGVSQDFHQAERERLLAAAKRQQPHEDAQARTRGHLQQGDGGGATLHGHLTGEQRPGQTEPRARGNVTRKFHPFDKYEITISVLQLHR